ncbi:P-loop containing nucleoside triphosphate hydrolase protein [Thamnocephalis sphaerospora]|uniref:P-loop containing nucleoside triphosphate hydrolase protein n=1 Tax=Thamnocephalis sphaerospora TaxID=78915 RepID=A0A4P9XNC3_9FUNG|nr:P-loop containing nucleoside triphosphate hydrolase protein [Thamnocephalis sphaerospora]|eukprot:RKP06901.1 P-loop containing nucleoside triphosphate hydrolase protein [Thamnocephalis sphaerospora]
MFLNANIIAIDKGPCDARIELSSDALHCTKPAEELQLVFRNLTYSVPTIDPTTKKTVPKIILDNITGVFQPGRLTTILGSSGSGKTSLLSALAGEPTTRAGELTGEMLINGQLTTGRTIRKMAGYVYQDDIILHTMTVREAVMLAAKLRTSSTISLDAKNKRVNDLLSFMHLNGAADTLIGNDRIAGISGGERKRTSIAMELVSNPAILFLDEPTSGLDTFTAYTVVCYLKQLAEAGYTVVTTLHQPSSEIFHLIDDLMILSNGRVLYMGSAKHSVGYFANQGHACPQYSNPADFFFMSIFYATLTSNTDSGDDSMTEATLSSARDAKSTSDVAASRKCVERLLDQFPVILRRAVRHAFRDRMVLGMKFVQTLVFAAVFVIVFWRISDRDQNAQIQDRTGVLFFFAANLVLSNGVSVLTVFFNERSTFAREARGGLYGLPAFFFSKMSIELPVYTITPILMISASYWFIGLNESIYRFFTSCIAMILISFSGMAIGLATTSFFQELPVALTVVPTFVMPMLVFSGMFVNIANLPAWIRWINWLSLMKYGFVALVKNEFEGTVINCGASVPTEMCMPISGETVIKRLGIDNEGSVWANICALALWAFFFIALAYLGLWRMTRTGRRRAKSNARKQ